MLEEDLNFFTNNDFSTFALVVGTNLIISGIFDEEYNPMLANTAEGKLITFCCQTTDVQSLRHGILLEIGERIFKIVGIQSSGEGSLTDLVLKET